MPHGLSATGGRLGCAGLFGLVSAGYSSSGKSITELTPAVALTSTSSGPPKPSAEGVVLANPFRSVMTLLWLTFRITGRTGFTPPSLDGAPTGRSTVVKNATLAAITEFGGEEESVTRTSTG
jgi:hypothetical protein